MLQRGIQRFVVQLHKWGREKHLQAVKSEWKTKHVGQTGKMSRETKITLQEKQKVSHKTRLILQNKQETCLAKARTPGRQNKKNCDRMVWEA